MSSGVNHILEGGYATRSNWVTAHALESSLYAPNSPDINVKLPYINSLMQVPHLKISTSTYSVTNPYNERGPNTQIFLNSTNVYGRQTLKLGTSIEIESSGGTNGVANSGTFTFSNASLLSSTGTTLTGNTAFTQSFANFLLGKPSSFTQTNVDAGASISANIYEGYVQDDVHLNPRLTFNGGVRYSYFAPPSNSTLEGSPFTPVLNFDPNVFNTSAQPTIDNKGNICTVAPCSGNGIPNPSYNSLNGIIIGGRNSPYGSASTGAPTKDIAPRIGFTYDVFGNGSTALRAGYGLYYFALPTNQAKAPTNQDPPSIFTTTIANPSFGSPGNGVAVLGSAPNVLQALGVNSPAPYSQQYSLGIQHQFGKGTVLDVSYVGNHGVHLFANVDNNQAPAGLYASKALIAGNVVTAGNTPLLNQIRPYLGYSAITTQQNYFSSHYDSLQTSVRERLGGGVVVTASYTYAKALTNARTPQNTANIAAEYGETDNDRRNVFNASFVYPLPIYREQRGVVGRIVGGFELSGIISIGSGEYNTPTTTAVDPGGVGLLVGPATGRPDIVSNPNVGAPHTQLQWFNTSAFTLVPTGQYRPGDAPPNDILGPGYQVWNLSAFKNIKLEKGVSFQFRGEAFNAFNHVNFTGIQTQFGSSNYGQVTGAAQQRVLQLGGKLTF